LRRAWLSASER